MDINEPGWLAAGLRGHKVTIEGGSEVDLDAVTQIVTRLQDQGEAKVVREVAVSLGIDRSLAEALAHFCSTLLFSQRAFSDYKESNVKKVQWLGPCCDTCDKNEGVKVVLGESFPSGHLYPPGCDYCTCALSPWMDLGI